MGTRAVRSMASLRGSVGVWVLLRTFASLRVIRGRSFYGRG